MKRNRLLLLGWAVFGLAGCTSLPEVLQSDPVAKQIEPEVQVVPESPEGQLLARLGTVEAGKDMALAEGVRGTAEGAYTAASGRICRLAWLHYPDGRSAQRLACEVEGRWQWMPAVTAQLEG